MSRPNLPSILMTAPSPVVSSMHIETSVLDPIIATPSFARFVLEKKGILDQNSVITLSITPKSDTRVTFSGQMVDVHTVP